MSEEDKNVSRPCVQIGPSRRMTLSELSSLASCLVPSCSAGVCAKLELVDASGKKKEDDVAEETSEEEAGKQAEERYASLLKLVKEENVSAEEVWSVEDSLVGLALLAHALSQKNSTKWQEAACEALIQTVHVGQVKHDLTLPRNAATIVSLLSQSQIVSSEAQGDADAATMEATVKTCMQLASLGLSVDASRSLALRGVVEVSAALSAERVFGTCSTSNTTGVTTPMDVYGEHIYGEHGRYPHTTMAESALCVRSLLSGTKQFAPSPPVTPPNTDKPNDPDASSNKQQAAMQAVQNTPTIHGPARDTISKVCRSLELELNATLLHLSSSKQPQPPNQENALLLMLARQTLDAVTSLHHAALARTSTSSSTSTPTADAISISTSTSTLEQTTLHLRTTLLTLQSTLQSEYHQGLSYIHTTSSAAMTERRKKEQAKAARAAAHAQKSSAGNHNTKEEDEFAGMSEEKKAKILKKRAEKEAKAAAKRKKKAAAAGGAGAGAGGGATTLVEVAGGWFGVGSTKVFALLCPFASIASTGEDGTHQEEVKVELTPSLMGSLEGLMEALLSGGVQRKPKIPKGTRDYLPDQMMIRDQAFQIIRRVFKRHGAVEIDTPVFELKETLTGKYGEDSKLIYDLADQGGELLSLRYDLTVPFARFLALNTVGHIKRFHIGKVYRRDQPALKRGRYREFYQCDFDIAGVYGRMVPDAECVAVVIEILSALPLGVDFELKLNHRRLLDAILDLCGVPSEKFRTICSAVDKLDKEPWEVVKKEMVEQKGLQEEVADRIGTFVVRRGKPWEMYQALMEEKKFGGHEGAEQALEDLKILFGYLQAMGRLDKVSFDLSLARGLDYYTGVIYEAVCISGNTPVGSIGGGGRYDNLVSMFQEAGKVTPCVGVSVGVERVFTLMEAKVREDAEAEAKAKAEEEGGTAGSGAGTLRKPHVDILVASIGDDMMEERMKIARVLWDANMSAEYSQQESRKLNREIANALDRNIPFMVIVGEDELKEKKCKVKDLKARTEDLIDVKDLVRTLRGKGVVPVGCELAMEILKREEMEGKES